MTTHTNTLTRRPSPVTRWFDRAAGAAAAIALVCLASTATAQADEQFTVIKAGRIITVSGEEITDGEIVIVDGKVRLVGRNLEYPAAATVIDARRQTVMPGMIHLRSRAGLPGYTRSGVHTDWHVNDELYLDEIDFSEHLRHGFTSVCLMPAGTGLPGMSAVYRTAGPRESRLLQKDAYLRVTMSNTGTDKPVLRGAIRKAKEEIAKVAKARQEWEEKRRAEQQQQQQQQGGQSGGTGGGGGGGAGSGAAPTQQPPQPQPGQQPPAPPATPAQFTPPAIDKSHEPLMNLIEKKAAHPLVLEVSSASDVLHAFDVLKEEPNLPVRMYVGVRSQSNDLHYVLPLLAERKTPLLVEPFISSIAETTIRFNLPAELAANGCDITFVPPSDASVSMRNFRATTADVVRAGLPRNIAIKALTLNQARFVGLDSRLGTIEKGKDADLIFLDGDVLDPASRVKRVMIGGEIVWEETK